MAEDARVTQKNFLLVHGASHGARCWDRVVPVLTRGGHRVRAIDLPGRGGDGTPGWRRSLDEYAAAVVKHARFEHGPVVAVGHSLGGQVISAAAERAPELFERLVYVVGFLPTNGDSIVSLGQQDAHSEIKKGTRVSFLKGVVEMDPESFGPVFYGDCEQQDVAWVRERLVPESMRPSFAKARLSPERFGRVPRSYIRCTRDRAISPQLQDTMIERQGCEHVASLDSSHSPFVSMPEELVEAILRVVWPAFRPAPK